MGRGRGGRGSDNRDSWGRRGQRSAGMRPVTESARIAIVEQLEAFLTSDETAMVVPDLSNHERAVLHSECKKFGFTSKSKGKGSARVATVFKATARDSSREPAVEISLSADSTQLVKDYLKRFPASDAELANVPLAEVNARSSVAVGQAAASSGQTRETSGLVGAASFSAAEVASRQARWIAAQTAPETQRLRAGREALPIAAMRLDILQAIASHQVCLVAGETGCGKTTQVPQYILEEAWAKGKGCRIICTQPRRISAITISERIAAERGQKLGVDVGFTIRLDSSGDENSSVMLCTNGVLLRMMTHGNSLAGVTHVICDEIHERDKFADFLLILLREVLPRRPDLRVVLMSATLHSELFASYFTGCPIISVPGMTHPVTDVYLDDILPMINYLSNPGNPTDRASELLNVSPELQRQLDDAISAAFLEGSDANFSHLLQMTGAHPEAAGVPSQGLVNYRHSQTGASALMVTAGKNRLEETAALLSCGADPRVKASNGSTAVDWARNFQNHDVLQLLQDQIQALDRADEATSGSELLSHYQSVTDADMIDLDLIVALIAFICSEPANGQLGAILVFLPGWSPISTLKELLERQDTVGSQRHLVLPLHSMVAPAEQRRAFARPPEGVRKIVLATNIAETSVTIEDVVCVINSGKMNDKSYDPYTGVSTFQSQWISRASEKQRRGRAGRCQPGVCFHIYSKQRSEALQEFQLPELQRTPLDEICLQVKMLEGKGYGSCKLAEFLRKAVEPPPLPAVQRAIELLESIGALEPETEGLTLLGRHLAALPLPPRLGKMLLYGILFDCLDPILTVACFMSYRPPWIISLNVEAKKRMDAEKKRLVSETGGYSDHLILIKAFCEWEEAAARGSEYQYLSRMALNKSTMKMVQGMRSQLVSELQAGGFMPSLRGASGRAGDAAVVRGVIGAALYPQFGQAQLKRKPWQPVKILTASTEQMRVDPASINTMFSPTEKLCVLVFEERMRSGEWLYAQQTTVVIPHVLLLVGNRVQPERTFADDDSDNMDFSDDDDRMMNDGGEGRYREFLLDGWLRLGMLDSALTPLVVLRRRLAECFAAKVQHPSRAPAADHAALLETLAAVFAAEARSHELLGTLSAAPASYPPGIGRGRGGGWQRGGRASFPGGRASFPLEGGHSGRGGSRFTPDASFPSVPPGMQGREDSSHRGRHSHRGSFHSGRRSDGPWPRRELPPENLARPPEIARPAPGQRSGGGRGRGRWGEPPSRPGNDPYKRF